MIDLKIISGGQTGVDRAALDVALESDISCGGWCPSGRKAEDGVIPSSYPLTELPDSDYSERTKQNVMDSDGTLIIYFEQLYAGTRETYECCLQQHKPFLLINAKASETIERSAELILDFICKNNIHRLNVAGPRASEASDAYKFTTDLFRKFVSKLKK